MWQFSPPTRFGVKYRDEIVKSPNIHLYTNANVVEVEANEPVSAVQSVRIRTFEGKEYRARAKRFVLACHTIQNARLLLASNRQATAGLGNSNDLVGYLGDEPGIPVIASAGSIAVFSSTTFHRSGFNGTSKMRRVYLTQYSPEPIMRPDNSGYWGMAEPLIIDGKRVNDGS